MDRPFVGAAPLLGGSGRLDATRFAVMFALSIFAAFANTDVASIHEFGVGLAIAVILDATVVRLVVLPAALAIAGRGAWWPHPAPRRVPAVVPVPAAADDRLGALRIGRAQISRRSSSRSQ